MTLTLMQNTEDARVVNKTPVSLQTFTGTLRSDCSIVDPVVVLEIDQTRLNMPLINYAYIPDFNRYYFIENITVVREGLWEISLHCDVLKTYAGQIRALPAVVSRIDEPLGDIVDTNIVTEASRNVTTIKFPDALPQQTYILAMIGRRGAQNETVSN